jgi:hypothetical protein
MIDLTRASSRLARRGLTLIGFLLASTIVADRARGDIIYQTGFESPAFTAGSTVDGQGGFSVTTGDPNAITVTTSQPRTGAQALLFSGLNLSDSPPPNGPGFFVGTAGVAVNYDAQAGGNALVSLEASIRLDGPSTATGIGHTGDLVSFNLEAILGDGSYFSTYLSSDGNAYGYSQQYDAMTPVALGVYHDVKLLLDFGARTSTYVVDGLTFGTKAFDPSVTSSVLANVQFTMYAIDPPADRSLYTARADDFSVRAVPEPSSLALCLIGGLVTMTNLARRRRGGSGAGSGRQ